MAKYSSSINYKITTSLDASGITKLQAELNKLQQELTDLNKRNLMTNAQTQEAIQDIERIERALKKAFNPNLGMISTKTLMSELTAGGRSLTQIYNGLGTRGTAVMGQLYGQIGKIDTGMKSVSKTTDKVFNTLGNTVRWGVIASGFQYVLNGAHSAVRYMADLDKSLTNIRLVTDESKESMREFAQYANDAAKSLGNTTVAYTDAALIYAQQGYGLSDQKTLANYTLMTANATGQDTAEVSEQMTALINGFQLSVEDVGSALDVMAKVANTSAADLEELATAASKVASTANTLGVTQEQLTAQIATIVSVTREAPENVGNALKTIYARFGDLSLGETLEDGTDLGKVSSTLQKIGVQVLDSSGAMRDMGLIMEDLMAVWDTLDTATKQGAAVTLAGKYQYNRLMALMENSDMYEGYYDDAINSAGTLEEMQSEYMESLAGKAKALQASFEGLLTDLFNQDDFGVVLEGLTEIIDKFDELIEAIGGGGAALTAFGAIGMNVFSNQIGRSISNAIGNREKAKQARENINQVAADAKAGALSQGVSGQSSLITNMGKDIDSVNRFASTMNAEQIEMVNQKHQEYAEAVVKADAAEKQRTATLDGAKMALTELGIGTEEYRNNVIAMLQTLEAGDASLDDLKNTLSRLRDVFSNTQSSIVSFANSIEKVDANSDKVNWTTIQKNAKSLIPTLTKAKKEFQKLGASDDEIKLLNKALEELGRTATGDQQSFQRLHKVLQNCSGIMDKFRVNAESAAKAEKILAQDAIAANNAVNSQTNVINNIRDSYTGLQHSFERQSMAAHFANMASGAMSLMFAIQSLQSLGSIWENEDLELGEKITQTLMNGTMTAAMLSMAYVEMSNAMKAFKIEQGAATVLQALYNKLKEEEAVVTATSAAATASEAAAEGVETAAEIGNTAATEANNAAKVKNIAFTEVLTLATKKLAVATANATKALFAFGGAHPALLAAGAAIALMLVQVGRANEAIKTAMSNYTEEIKRHEAVLEKAESSNYENLYKIWSTTKESSEELKTAALELADSLGIVGAEALVEAGNFEALNDEIERGIEKTKELLESNRAGQNALISNANTVFDWRTDAFQQGFDDEFTRNLNFSSRDENVIAATGIQFDTFGTEVHGYSFAEQVGKIYQGIEDEQAKIDELTLEITAKKNAGEDTSELERELATRRQTVQDLRAITTNEKYGISDFTANTEGLAQSQIENADFSNLSYEEAMEKAKSLEGVVDYYAIYGEEAGDAFVQSVLGKLSYGTEVALDQWTTNAKNNIPEGEAGSEEKVAAIDNLSNTILNSSAYSEDDKIKIVGALDEEMTTEEINNTINAINEGKSVEEVALEAGGEDARENVKAAYNSEGETKAQEFGIDVEEFKDYRDLLAESNEELENNAKALNTVALADKRMQKGLNELTENWEDWNEVLSDSNLTAAEFSEISPEINDAFQDLMGLSEEEMSLLPKDFVKDHWDQLQDVVNNVEGSYDEMQRIVGQELLLKLGLDETEIANLYTEVDSILGQYDMADIQVGATLDTLPFHDSLMGMLDSSQYTVEEMSAILNSLNFAPQVDYVEVPVNETAFDSTTSTYTYTDPVTGEQKTAKVESELQADQNGMLQIPVINSGGTVYKGPPSPRVGSGKGSGGGGGGGGGGSSYTPKTEKKSDAEADRYQDVNAHLDRLSGNLEKVANEQDRLVGKDMLDNMNEQLDILEQQVEWHQRKLEIQQQEAAELRSELGQDYGITFNSEGYMENYEAIFNKYKSEYDALVDQYNATSDEEGQEKIKEQMDEVQEKWDKFNESIERYDELVNNEILESINTLEDLENQMEDLRIEAFNMAVEAADSIKEVKDAWADYMGFMSGLNPDSPFRSLIQDAEKYENAIESVAAKQQDLDQLMQWAPQYQAGGVITSDNPFGENSAAFYEALQTAYESYIEAALAAEELYYQQIDDIMEGYDEVVDKISKRMEKYARLTEQLDHYASVIETLYGDEDYDKLLAIKRANQDVLESSIEQSKRSLETLQAEYEKQKAAGILGEEQLEELRQHVVEAEQELEGLVEEAAQNIMDILEMEVDSAVSKWKNAMLGGDADWMETQWELAKQNAELYLDTVEETYELEKLRSKYNSLANDTMDLNIRKRINDQMEQELSYLREKDKLSEYDINYANAKLEILQKQIALEEAQANKNQMKLRRDSQGNYSYVYSANQDDVTNAQNELMDAEFNAYNMSKENYTQTYDNYLSYVSNIAEQIRQISLNTELEEDERNERIAELKKYLAEYIASISDQLTASQRGMLESVALLAEDTSGITGETFKQISEMMQEDWTAALEAIGVATNDNFVKLMTNMESFFTDTEALWSDLEKSLKDWAERVELIADDGTKGFRNIDDVIIDINKDMKELNDETENFFGLINDDLGTIDGAIGKLANYEKQIRDLTESSSQIAAQLRDARDLVIKQENDIRELQDQLTAERNKNSNPNPGGNSGGGGNNDASDKTRAASVATEALKIVEGVHNGTIANGSGGWRPAARKAGYSEDAISVALAAFNDSKAGGGYSYYYDKALELVKSYDTGGYTGAWGKEGRLAMLHQKELVLNAADTENILAAVSTIRDVIAAMKGDSLSSILSLGRSSNIANNTGTNIQQNIEIYADFPAAESAAEIKTALEGLAQQAVQYSMRTR